MPNERPKQFWKRLQVTLFIGGLAASLCWYSLWEHYVKTRPRTIQSETDRVIPLRSHGLVVYLTKNEDRKLTLFYSIGCVLGLSIVAIHLLKEPFKR